MTLEIELSVSDDILSYRLRGVTTLESMTQLADRIREDARINGLSGALLDCAGMTGALQISVLHKVGEYFGRNLHSVRLAAINAPSSWKANHFSEDVVGSKGGELKHFASRESAKRWLQKS
jgi:hypothetical protein